MLPYLFVQLDLGARVGTSLFQSGTKILDVARKDGPVLFSLRPVCPFNEELFVKLLARVTQRLYDSYGLWLYEGYSYLSSGLKLLDLLGVLRSKSSFIFDLCCHRCHFLFFALESCTQVGLDSL